MLVTDLIKDAELSDDRFDFYHPIVPVQIFNYLLDEGEAAECRINITKGCDLAKILPVLNDYLKWLKDCKEEVTAYFEEALGEAVPQDWFEEIEVLHFSITFCSEEDYGASIICGESVLPDHTIEFQFDKFVIEDAILNG